jgi:DNA-binding PadR family transcriptional regulator
VERNTTTEDDRRGRLRRSFLQGTVKLFILQQAAHGPVYGREINKALGDLGYELSPGTLYPFLHTLEQEHLLSSSTKPVRNRVRRYYTLTAEGRSCLTEVREEFAALMKKIFTADAPHR